MTVGHGDHVGILRRQNEFGLVDDDVIVGVLGILHGAEERIGAAIERDVESTTAVVHLMEDGDDGEERGA